MLNAIMTDPTFAPPEAMELACQEVLAWLREPHRNPMFLVGHSSAKLNQERSRVVERFLSWALPAGFAGDVMPVEFAGVTGYRLDWTYRGSELVGFKQPDLSRSPVDAQLLASAALLRNEWCRNRLP
jgi:hypothetical protein